MFSFVSAFSNVFFSARAVLSKVLAKARPDALNEISLFTYISGIGVFVSLPFTFFFDLSALYGPEYSEKSIGMLPLVILYVLNGLAYSTYNLVSFMVLMRVNIATHAVLNVFRRVFIIGNTVHYLMHLCIEQHFNSMYSLLCNSQLIL
jgi:solute carrier family 35, member E1